MSSHRIGWIVAVCIACGPAHRDDPDPEQCAEAAVCCVAPAPDPACPPGATACGSLSPDDFCTQFAAAACGNAARCAPGNLDVTVDACSAGVRDACMREAETARASGPVTWRGDRATECLELLEGPCANREIMKFRTRDPCAALWAGARQNGADCDTGAECESGDCWCGRCAAPPNSLSPDGCACDSSVDPGHCRSGWCAFGTCMRERTEGESCEYSTVASTVAMTKIAPTTPCAPGMACIEGTCTVRFAGAGDPCSHIRECATGLTCLSSGRCGPYRGEGELCALPLSEWSLSYHSATATYAGIRYQWTGEGGDCELGLACLAGTCRRRPASAAALCGDPCRVMYAGKECAEAPCFGVGLSCVAESSGSSCRSGGSGAACVSDGDCNSPLACRDGVCLPLRGGQCAFAAERPGFRCSKCECRGLDSLCEPGRPTG